MNAWGMTSKSRSLCLGNGGCNWNSRCIAQARALEPLWTLLENMGGAKSNGKGRE